MLLDDKTIYAGLNYVFIKEHSLEAICMVKLPIVCFGYQ